MGNIRQMLAIVNIEHVRAIANMARPPIQQLPRKLDAEGYAFGCPGGGLASEPSSDLALISL
jgi:hypothetical protein